MHFSTTTLLSAIALATASFSHAATLAATKRQGVVPTHGLTVQPVAGSAITPGDPFAFRYENANACESGYSPMAVYLSASAPMDADVRGGELVDGSFEYKFGDFLIANFGLPSMGTPPPATLTAPSLNVAEGAALYLSVVETYRDCPGGVQLEYGLETTTVVYA
ncbi:hypothetical protein BN946_scf184805.g10 [Trametes cinnabarina]|uniref:Auxilliary Activities Family 9 protein n=1 Tax=Pycnoporus cinnabarinus TaxID=5643 RepID=A0A060S3U0_PYCCI|nr:hypothetical protein BN946_scf184805.g10 [Trametes cinnabarina]